MEYFQSNDTANVIQFNDYTGTREEFWRENFVKDTLEVSMNKSNVLHIYYYHLYCLAGCPESRVDNERGRRTLGYLI